MQRKGQNVAASKTKKMKLKSKSKISAKNKSSAKAKTNKPAVKAKTKIQTKTNSPVKKKLIAKGKTKSSAGASASKGAHAKKALAKAKPVVKKSSAKNSATLAKAKSAAEGSAVKKSNVKVPTASKAVALAQFQPLDDRLLVQIASKEKRTAGGLYIPDTASVSGNFQAVVVAVGVGHKNKKGKIRPMDVQVGDTVLINEYAGDKVEFESKEYRILRETDVLGIQEK
jgi:chaperonin GroES